MSSAGRKSGTLQGLTIFRQCVLYITSLLTQIQDSPIFQLQVTFAALQESSQSVFNPSRLVESLHLRTSEQQDAQEYAYTSLILYHSLSLSLFRFSKLFMSHLDAEFKEQADPTVRMLIESQVKTLYTSSLTKTSFEQPLYGQFQGSQVYGTHCHTCKYQSERTSDFLEMEVGLDVSLSTL